MYIAILGRQPHIGMAELERLYGAEATRRFSSLSATISAEEFLIEQLGGTQKAGRVVIEFPAGDWRRISMGIVKFYQEKWRDHPGKLTLGLSAYGFSVPARDVQKTGLILKQKMKEHGVSLRLIPNPEAALNSAASHHNKLGLSPNKIELLIIKAENGRVIVAESTGAQNITSLARRDQGRPKRDAFVGMLPPKLAQIILNLAIGPLHPERCTILDPFCGTGVILQEALLRGCTVSGSDLNPKMVDYTLENLQWLEKTMKPAGKILTVEVGDAMDHQWRQVALDAIACETYLGQPFSAPPSPAKLTQVRGNCEHIIGSFLKNIASQIPSGTPLCLAVPAWRNKEGNFTHLPLVAHPEPFGFRRIEFTHVDSRELLYYREDQIVARELLVLIKT